MWGTFPTPQQGGETPFELPKFELEMYGLKKHPEFWDMKYSDAIGSLVILVSEIILLTGMENMTKKEDLEVVGG